MPDATDLALMPAVCRIFDVPNEVQVTSLDLVSVTAQLASLVERRSERVKTVLITLLTKDAELPNDESCSDLAIAFFICRNCRRLYHYSKVVAHQCVRFEYVDGEGVDGYVRVMLDSHSQGRSLDSELRLVSAVDFMWCLLDGCAKDPSTTTRQDLDDMSMRVCCTIPSKPCTYTMIMTWRMAVHLSLSTRAFRAERVHVYRWGASRALTCGAMR